MVQCPVFDRIYRQRQAQYGFRWGSDSPHLTAVNLKPKQVFNSMDKSNSTRSVKVRHQSDKFTKQRKQTCVASTNAEGCSYGDKCKFKHCCLAPFCEGGHSFSDHPKKD